MPLPAAEERPGSLVLGAAGWKLEEDYLPTRPE